MAYGLLVLVGTGAMLYGLLRRRTSSVSKVILGFAHSMDRTSLYAASQRSNRIKSQEF